MQGVNGTGVARLSRIGLGCSRIGSFGNPQPLSEGVALVRAALDLGVRVIDTASIYGQGDSERAIGRAIAGRRDDAFVVTKAGQTFSTKMRLLRPLKPLLRPLLAKRGGAVTARRDAVIGADWRPASLAASLDASLRRLGTGHVDAFLLHSPPAAVARDPAVAATLADVRRSGKALHVGVSCDDLDCLDAALDNSETGMLQLPYDMIAVITATPRADRIRARGILVLAREVIAMQTGLAPLEAIAAAVADPLVDCALVGTTRRANLAAAAERVR